MKTRKFLTPPLHWLRAFEATARHLSFTHAAEELCLTQSAVSKQVRLLESHLKTELFLREHRGLQLTEAGRNYLPTILRAFSSLEQGTRTFLGYTTTSNLRITANYSFAILWLAEYLHEFLALYPDLQVTVSTAHWEQDFSGGAADVEIHYGSKDRFDNKAIQLAEEYLFPVCAPDRGKTFNEPQQLAKKTILDLTGIRDGWSYWVNEAEAENLEFGQRHFISSFAIAYKMAKTGQYITLGQSSLVNAMLGNGELCKPLKNAVVGRDHYFVQKNPFNTQHKDADKFVDWIVSKIQENH